MVRIIIEWVEQKTNKLRMLDVEESDVYIFKHHVSWKYICKLWDLFYNVQRAWYARNERGKLEKMSIYDLSKSVPKRATEEDKERIWNRKAYSPIAKASPRLTQSFISSQWKK